MGSIVKFTRDSHLQRIRAHYVDESLTLTAHEEDMLKRLKFVFALRLNNKYSRQQAVKKCQEEFDVSAATAYRDYAAATYVFGELDDVDNRGERMILREEYWFLYQQNIKDRNWAEAKKALDSYRELFDFSSKEGEIEPDKIAAHNYIIKMSKQLEKALLKTVEGGSIDLNNMDVEDVPYEEVKDERKK